MDINWTILMTAGISVMGIILAVFSASWLNQRATERQIESVRNELKADNEVVKSEIKRVDHKIESFDKTTVQRFDSVQLSIDRIERQLEVPFKPTKL